MKIHKAEFVENSSVMLLKRGEGCQIEKEMTKG